MNKFGKYFGKGCIGAFLIGLSCAVFAQCNDKPFAPCKLYETADVIFVGTVKEVDYSEPIDEIDGLTKKRLRNKTVLLIIKESFKGITEKQTETFVTISQIQRRSQSGELIFEKHVYADCPFDEFAEDETYLIYAKRPSSERQAGLFAEHAVIASEADEALTYLQNRKAGKQGAMLYGRLVRKMRPLGDDLGDLLKRPIRNTKVEIQSETQRFITTTDEKGNYLFFDIPPDEYSIKVDLPERLNTATAAKKLTLATKSCIKHDIEALSTGQISGTVLNHEGKPKGVEIELVVAAEATAPKPRRFVVSADWQSGKFEFRNIPPAQYLLGVNLSKLCRQQAQHGGGAHFSCHPRTYYPGVSDVAQATLITLTEGKQLKDFDFRLPPPFSKRIISGVAFLSDRKPAANAEISLMIVEGDSVEFGSFTQTDEYGQFSISAYHDLKSWISANIKIKGKDWHSEPVDLSTGNDVDGIKLVLSSSGKFCSLCYSKYWKRKGTPPQ